MSELHVTHHNSKGFTPLTKYPSDALAILLVHVCFMNVSLMQNFKMIAI